MAIDLTTDIICESQRLGHERTRVFSVNLPPRFGTSDQLNGRLAKLNLEKLAKMEELFRRSPEEQERIGRKHGGRSAAAIALRKSVWKTIKELKIPGTAANE
jgi:hypothetical protein